MHKRRAIDSNRQVAAPLRRALVNVAGIGIVLGSLLSEGAVFAQSAARAIATEEWMKVVNAARKEGKVVVYTTTAPAVHARIKADFERAYPGMEMEAVRLVGAQLSVKLEQERQIANFDGGDAMITSEIGWSVDATKKGWLRIPMGPAAAVWPDAYIKQGAVPLLGINPFVLVYNTKLVKTPPGNYQDLLKPEFKGKIGMAALVGDVVVGWYDWLEKTQGPGFLSKLASQDVRMYPGAVPPTQDVAAGELLVNTWTVFAVTNPLIESGAPIKTVVTSPSYGASYAGGIVSWAKRPNAALLFMDYMMSARGQAIFVGNGELASPLSGIPGSLDAKTVTLHDSEKYPPEVQNAFKEKWNTIFKPR